MPVRNELTAASTKGEKNSNLESPYNKSNIKAFLKSKRVEWAGYVWQAEGKIF